MSNTTAVSIGVLALTAVTVTPARAQERSHVVPLAEVEATVLSSTAQEEADRETVRRFLRDERVQGAIARTGYDANTLAAAVETLDGPVLRELAVRTRTAQEELSGGATTIVISSTAIIIGLLILIIILVAD